MIDFFMGVDKGIRHGKNFLDFGSQKKNWINAKEVLVSISNLTLTGQDGATPDNGRRRRQKETLRQGSKDGKPRAHDRARVTRY
jgi:hypothetical protein